MHDVAILFHPYELNPELILPNRIVMAPMTRAMATDDFVPTEAMAAYYAKRAAAGLIVTEGTIIARDATGYRAVPGIYNADQVDHWRVVTEAVHANDGRIFMQLWHVGRVSHPDFLQGAQPAGPSAATMHGRINRGDGLTFGESRALHLKEIQTIVAQFAQAATHAMRAGFDGVELHGANGYLIDQFLHYDSNHRTDAYGGSVHQRTRFAMEVVKAVGEAIGSQRVGLRLSPGAYIHEIVGDARDAAVFSDLLQQLNHLPIAYVHTGNFDDSKTFAALGEMTMSAFLRKHYSGTLIACGSYTPESAAMHMTRGDFDLIAFGRPFIANPDLVARVRAGDALQPYEVRMLQTLN